MQKSLKPLWYSNNTFKLWCFVSCQFQEVNIPIEQFNRIRYTTTNCLSFSHIPGKNRLCTTSPMSVEKIGLSQSIHPKRRRETCWLSSWCTRHCGSPLQPFISAENHGRNRYLHALSFHIPTCADKVCWWKVANICFTLRMATILCSENMHLLESQRV